MFEFFATMFNKAISVLASVMVAIGLVFAPVQPQAELSTEQSPIIQEQTIDNGPKLPTEELKQVPPFTSASESPAPTKKSVSTPTPTLVQMQMPTPPPPTTIYVPLYIPTPAQAPPPIIATPPPPNSVQTPASPPPAPVIDTTPPKFTSGPTANLIREDSSGNWLLLGVDWATDEPATIVWPSSTNNDAEKYRQYWRLCAPNSGGGPLKARTNYNCILKVADAAGNVAEKPFAFTTGYGTFRIGSFTGNALGVSGGTSLVISFVNNDSVPITMTRLVFNLRVQGKVSTSTDSTIYLKDETPPYPIIYESALLFDITISTSLVIEPHSSKQISVNITNLQSAATGDSVVLTLKLVELDRSDIFFKNVERSAVSSR